MPVTGKLADSSNKKSYNICLLGHTMDTVQKKAWMDKTIMLDWIDLILAPYVAEAPAGIVPVLFLDAYRAHMMTSVVAGVQALGVDVIEIEHNVRKTLTSTYFLGD